MRNDEVATRVTRRTVLRLLGGAAGVGLLTACAPQAAAPPPTAAPAKPAESKPAEAAKPAGGAPAATTAPAAAAKPAEAPKPAEAAKPAQPTVSTQAAAKPAGEPKRGGVFKFAQSVEVATNPNTASPLDAHNMTPSSLSATWIGYDTLLEYDDNFKPQPKLAESWDVSSDFKKIQLKLRKGVQFHNGRDFTSEDVRYNLMRVRNPKVGAQFTNLSNWFPGIETPDPHTVVLTSEQPRPGMFDLLISLNMVNKDVTETDLVTKTSGSTGPFKFVEWVPGQHLRWAKNPNYWQSGKPYLDEVLIQFIPDMQSAIVRLEAGDVHAVDSPPAREAARFKDSKDVKMLLVESSGQYWVMVTNTTGGPTQNKKMRQALNYAIDRKRFIDTALGGLSEPEALPWLPFSPAYDATKRAQYTFDLDKAKALVAESGVGDPSIDFVYTGVVPELATFGQMFQADLAKIGVKLNLKGVERAVYNDLGAKFQFGLLMSTSGFANLDPAALPQISRYWDINSNLAGMNGNEQYKQLVTSASVESDAAKRKTILSNLNDLILDESFTIPVATSKHITLMRSNVNGFRFQPGIESASYTDVWLS